MALYVERRFTPKENRIGATVGKVYDCKDYGEHISWIDDKGEIRQSKVSPIKSDAYKNMEFVGDENEKFRNQLLKGGTA